MAWIRRDPELAIDLAARIGTDASTVRDWLAARKIMSNVSRKAVESLR